MGEIYKIKRGSLLDNNGVQHIKNELIDIDNFSNIKSRVISFIANGMIELITDLKSAKNEKTNDVEVTKEKLDIAIAKFSKEKQEFYQDKKNFSAEMQNLRSKFEKEVDQEWQKIKKAKDDLKAKEKENNSTSKKSKK